MLRSVKMAAAAVALLSVPAHATTISGTFSGTISTPEVHEGSTVWHTEGGQQLWWGATPDAPVAGGAGSSWLRVDNGAFSHDVRNGDRFLIGTLTWFNRSNWYSGGEWSSMLSLGVDFDQPTDRATLTEEVGFTSRTVSDTSRDVAANEASGDTPDELRGMSFAANAFDVPVALGNSYVLNSVSFDLLEQRAAGTMTQGDGTVSWFDAEESVWSNAEGGMSVIGIYGEISAVPLPAGMWLILSGLGGLLVMKRRSQTAA